MKRNLLIALSMLCVLTAIAGGTRIFKNKTANNAVVSNALSSDYEDICMALDCLDGQLLSAMQENDEFAFANVDKQISDLRAQVEVAKNNGKINRDEFIAAMDEIQCNMK